MNPDTKSWSVIRYERDRLPALQNSLCRVGIACVIPMIKEWNSKFKRDNLRPALPSLAFIPGTEDMAQRARSLMYVEEVWRNPRTGELMTIADSEFQAFMDRLSRRDKKPSRLRKTMNLGALAEQDAFELVAHLFGAQVAIKQFGKDLSSKEIA